MTKLEKLGLDKSSLKPCPFCGGHGELGEVYEDNKPTGRWFVKCYTCGGSIGVYGDPHETAARWNRRGGFPIELKY